MQKVPAVMIEGGGGGGAPASIGGSPTVGSTLSVVFATGWSASAYQWERNGVAISGQTGSTYVVQVGDAGTSIACQLSTGGLIYTTDGVTISGGGSGTGPLSLSGLVLSIDGAALSLA